MQHPRLQNRLIAASENYFMSEFFKKIPLREFVQTSYFTLWLILIVCILLAYGCIGSFFNESICSAWLKDFAVNLTAEIIGIILVLFLVNRTIEKHELQEKQKFRTIAFRHLKVVLHKQFYLLFNMFKASIIEKPNRNYESLADLFDNTYFAEVGFLDLLKIAPTLTQTGEEMIWLDYLFSEFSNLSSALYKVLDRYSFYLDSEIVDLLEEIADADLISFIAVIREANQCHQVELQGDLLAEAENILKEYTSLFVRLVDLYNQSVNEKKQIKVDSDKWIELWGNNIRPKIGESRISCPT